jgi:hypothetical protein
VPLELDLPRSDGTRTVTVRAAGSPSWKKIVRADRDLDLIAVVPRAREPDAPALAPDDDVSDPYRR